MRQIGASAKDYPVHAEPQKTLIDTETAIAKIVKQIKPGSRVLDVGCATGYLAELLRPKHSVVTGIEVNPTAAKTARQHCAAVIVADLEAEPLSRIVKRKKFDVIVFADILEHVRAPGAMLKSARRLLTPRGLILASIPNVAHGAIRLSLLMGNFDYTEFGLLDDAHVRFFTARSLDEMFMAAGYRIEQVDRTSIPLFDNSDLVPHVEEADFAPQVIEEVRRDPEHETLQFIVRAVPISEAARNRELAKRFLLVNTEVARVTALLRRRESETERASALATELEARYAETATELRTAQESVVNMQQALQARDDVIDHSARRIRELEEETGKAHSALRERDAEAKGAASHIAALESQLVQMTDALRFAEEEMLQAKAALQARDSEAKDAAEHVASLEMNLASAKCAADDLHLRLGETQRRLLEQTNAFLAATQTENERLALLIDTVQSSRFWKVKRIMSRVRQALSG